MSEQKNAVLLEDLLTFLEEGGIDTSKLNIVLSDDEDED